MRSGCFGCLTLLALGIAVAGVVWLGALVLGDPGWSPPTLASEGDGLRAQQKIYGLLRRAGRDPVVLTERELNGFVRHHLRESDLPFEAVDVRLVGAGTAEITGRLPLVRLLDRLALGALAETLPGSWRQRPLWLGVTVRPVIERPASDPRRRALRFDVERGALGRLSLPSAFLRVVLDPDASRALRWRLPDRVEEVRIEAGRVVVTRTGG